MNVKHFKRSFVKPEDPLQGLFIQILLYQYNSTSFNTSDLEMVAQAYGQIFFKFEDLWQEVVSSFVGLSKEEIEKQIL